MCALNLSDDKSGDKGPVSVHNPQEVREYFSGLAEAMENSPLPFAICRSDGRLLNCNRAFSDLTGYKKDELYSMADLSVLTSPYYRDIDSRILKLLSAGERPGKYEKEIIRQDNSRVFVEACYGLVMDAAGKPKLYYYFMNDLTDSIRLKEDNRRLAGEIDREGLQTQGFVKKLHEQADEINVMLNSLTEAVTIFDLNCIMIRANDAAIACYGFNPSGMGLDALNRKMFFRYQDGRRVSPEESPQALAVNGDNVPPGRFMMTGVDGQDILVLLSAVPLYSGGRISGAVCTWQDITEHDRLLRQMDKDRNLLHESIMQTDLYFDLMSHDIVNINQIGIGYMELALEDMGPDDERRKLLMKSFEAFKSSSNLIDNLSKIKRARDTRMEAVDLGKLLAGVKGKFLGAGGRELDINYNPQDNCFVLANDLLQDVFTNILGNSAKHSEGPLSIDISLARVFEDGRTFFKVSVDDNGPGIPDELKSKIFVRSHRNMTKARSKGIGLYLVKSLLEGFDGRVWVEDRVQGDYSKGSRFVVMLPALKR